MLEWYTWDKKELQFNKIVANPPFSKNQDVKHILHMYELLEEWGRIVSIASSMIQHKQTKLHDELRALSPEFIEVEEWAFEESGTMVRTCIVIINK
jgi:16S rRNA G1207 methylase RsmC